MKRITLVLSLLLSVFAYTQDTATVHILVENPDGEPLQGEQILFEAQSGNFATKGVTTSDGKSTVYLLGEEIYDIKMKSIGDALDYNTFEVPALPPNTTYGENTITIVIYEPKEFTLDNVLFETGKSTLKASSKTELEELYEYMSLKPDLKIEIGGHTDNVGEEEANLILSQARADAVRDYLIEKGISADRVVAKGYGEALPVASNDTASGRQQNRRTAVSIL
ncbi:MAG: OmpA family protein [Chitinophagales bacterium]